MQTLSSRFWLGITQFELGDWEQTNIYLTVAVQTLNGSKLTDVNSVEARYILGRARMKLGRYQDATEPLQSITGYSEDLSHIVFLGRYHAALAWYECGCFTAAKRHLLQLKPSWEKKNVTRGQILALEFLNVRCLIGLGFHVQGRAELERIIEVPWYNAFPKKEDETLMLAHYDLARIAYWDKDWTRVVHHIQTAMERHEMAH
jgi:tetratricopeptide (TPR) repeat protein